MDPSCLRLATEKLSEASKTKIYSLRSSTDSIVLPGPDEAVWTATAKATKSMSSSDLPQVSATSSVVVPPVRNTPVSPGRQKIKRQTKPKPSVTPPPSSPDILKPVPTPMARRSLSSMRFDNSAFGGNSMFGAVSAALGSSIMRPPSTPQHQAGSHHVTPTHSMSPTPSSTPTRKRPKPYTNLSPALLKQNPTNQTLAAAVTASASAANLDRCAPPLQEHLSSGGNSQSNGSNNTSNLSRAAALFYSNSSTMMGGGTPFGIPRQSLSPARPQSVQQINMQRRQLQQFQHHIPPRGLSPSRNLMPQPRSLSTPPYQFSRQQPSKRK